MYVVLNGMLLLHLRVSLGFLHQLFSIHFRMIDCVQSSSVIPFYPNIYICSIYPVSLFMRNSFCCIVSQKLHLSKELLVLYSNINYCIILLPVYFMGDIRIDFLPLSFYLWKVCRKISFRSTLHYSNTQM